MKQSSFSSFLKLLAIAFFALTASVSLAETDYLAILLQEKKIGYAKHTREVQDGKVITPQTAFP
jgi:DUF438 domain-containing protein